MAKKEEQVTDVAEVIEQAEAPEETTVEEIVADPVHERILAAQRAITGL